MNKDQIKKALTELRANPKKRNFDQSIDFIANLKDINIKKTEENVDVFSNDSVEEIIEEENIVEESVPQNLPVNLPTQVHDKLEDKLNKIEEKSNNLPVEIKY